MDKVRLKRDAPHQIYTLKDGSVVGGASSVAKMGEDYGGLLYWYWQQGKAGKGFKQELNKAADTGEIGHFMVDCYLKKVEPDLREYTKTEIEDGKAWFDKAMQFLTDFPIDPMGVELQMVSETHRYGGTLDVVGRADKKIRLVDWKSSKKIYDSQLRQVVGGYRTLWNVHNEKDKIEEVVIVRIPKDKDKYEAHWVDPEDFDYHQEVFLAQVKLFNVLHDKKKEKKKK